MILLPTHNTWRCFQRLKRACIAFRSKLIYLTDLNAPRPGDLHASVSDRTSWSSEHDAFRAMHHWDRSRSSAASPRPCYGATEHILQVVIPRHSALCPIPRPKVSSLGAAMLVHHSSPATLAQDNLHLTATRACQWSFRLTSCGRRQDICCMNLRTCFLLPALLSNSANLADPSCTWVICVASGETATEH